jgi:SanA protein
MLIWLVLLAVLVFGIPRLVTGLYAHSRIYTAQNVPPARVAIVLGAGLRRDGTPTPVLEDRVSAAARLYFEGKVEKLLMSGDNRFVEYNEPAAMREYAIQLGIPAEDIVLDYAGRRTYDTCYRAAAIFQVKEAILVTQSFHLPRALYLCNHMGVKSLGVASDERVYRRSSQLIWNLRELPATLVALIETHITHPLPVLGNVEPIFPAETQS